MTFRFMNGREDEEVQSREKAINEHFCVEVGEVMDGTAASLKLDITLLF